MLVRESGCEVSNPAEALQDAVVQVRVVDLFGQAVAAEVEVCFEPIAVATRSYEVRYTKVISGDAGGSIHVPQGVYFMSTRVCGQPGPSRLVQLDAEGRPQIVELCVDHGR